MNPPSWFLLSNRGLCNHGRGRTFSES